MYYGYAQYKNFKLEYTVTDYFPAKVRRLV